MNIARLQDLLAQARARGETIDIVEDGLHVVIDPAAFVTGAVRAAIETPDTPDTSDASDTDAVHAPCYGIVHLTPAPGAPAFVAVGDAVAMGQRVCLIEAMKVFHAVTAPRSGRVEAILAESGHEVARGQALMRITEPAAGT